jgi:hypothetical protein
VRRENFPKFCGICGGFFRPGSAVGRHINFIRQQKIKVKNHEKTSSHFIPNYSNNFSNGAT